MSCNKRIDPNTSVKNSKGGGFSEIYDGRKELHNLAGGDMYYIPNLIKSKREKDQVFAKILQEVDFQQMFNFFNNTVEAIPRMISAQTDKTSSRTLIYRMPGCNESNIPTTNWTDTVKSVVEKGSNEIGQPLNHCVVTLFRNENDSLAFHQDKELDLKDNSLIVSISFGDPRPIVFEEIDGKRSIRIMLQPGSILVFGPKTNSRFRHAIPKLTEKVGPRISLSARYISTFIEHVQESIESNPESVTTSGFVILGKGEEHQTKNYPFIKSHDDVSEYTQEIKELIDKYRQEAYDQLKTLRGTYPVAEE
ncbi:2OG-FeII oxygenase superfamily protein [Yasminevirus sp. GU-2018]|uniref:2OG-FeII oxygenase superfamily protein n=1 Tax=Yasminevirus sp. GU-2018 TaxID=2420051 RepID=A0A5K0U824_9VIRU|nr:2OG-FeII oxygenase superfamily protein [Yasminevirus sp. GU-2018]